MNGIDVRIRPIDLILKHCRVHSVQFSFGSIRCCINITNENPCGGTFLVFKELSEADAEMAFRGEIQLTLLSERRGNVGTGVSCNTVALDSNVHSLQPASAGLTDTFTLLSGAESEISIVYETEGKPNIELGKFLVSIRLYALALVKDCPHKCASPRTEKESFMTLEDSGLVSEPSDTSGDDGSQSDTSLENFLRNLRARNTTQKAASGTQTPSGLPKKKEKHVTSVRRSHDSAGSRSVVAIMAPNPYLRPSTEVDYYALTETVEPELRDSVSVRSDRSGLRRLHHPPVIYDAISKRTAPRRPVTAPSKPPRTAQVPPKAPTVTTAGRPKTTRVPTQRPWH